MIPHSFREAQKLYNLSVNLANSWISKYYRGNSRQILGVPFEKIQAFSQHHFFSCLVEGKPINDLWSQYPRTTDKPSKAHFLQRTLQVVRNLTAPKVNIGHLDPNTQIVFLSSGRHLEDWQRAIFYLKQHFKILVVGKIPDKIRKKMSEEKIPWIDLPSARRFLTRKERFVDCLLFLRFFWQKRGNHKLFANPLWAKRLWYLRLEQFPEITALLKFARSVFEKTKPSLLLTTSSNDTFGSAFCLTAQKLEIPVAELQHGFASWPTDRAFANNDYHLVWGEIPKKMFSGISKELVIVGCPFLKKHKSLSINSTKLSKSKTRVLVLLTPPFGVIELMEKYPTEQVIERLIWGLAKLSKKILVTLRSHPSFPIQDFLDFDNLPSNIKLSKDKNAQESILAHDIIITQPTTAGFIAIIHKKPLLFFDNSYLTQKFSHPFIKSGSAVNIPCGSLDRIDTYVHKLLSNESLLMKQEKAQEKFIDNYCAYFGEDSCKKIAEFAEKIIDEKSSSN